MSKRPPRSRGIEHNRLSEEFAQAAQTIFAEIHARHLPFGTVLDPVFAGAQSNEIVGYSRAGDSAIWTGHYLAAESFRFAASGFRDFTRIAGSSPEMWRDIALANREALLTELDAYMDALQTMRAAVSDKNGETLLTIFSRARDARKGRL